MLPLALLLLLSLSLSHWFLEPLVRGLTPPLSSTGLGWLLLAGVVWGLAGAASNEPPNKPKS